MKKLTAGEQLLVGLTLFSMFFGAGNLIFPPFLGAQAGNATWIAMLGFAVSAIGFPVLGVMAIAKASVGYVLIMILVTILVAFIPGLSLGLAGLVG